MNSGELVRRLARLTASGGAGDDGAGLAAEYAEKLRALSRRMDAVETAQAKGEYGEAMRLMEERPRLLDEIGVLDFHQFGPWKALCEDKGWEVPTAVDGAAVERLLEGYNNSAAMDELLKGYRKAVRRHDVEGQVRALRRLAAGTGGGEWTGDLAGAEEAWAGELEKTFDAAVAAGDRVGARAAAEELTGKGWKTPPDGGRTARVRAWLDAEDAAERQSALEDCLARLKQFAEGEWNGEQAAAAVRQAQYLLGAGATADEAGAALYAEVSARCEREAKEAEAAENRRRFETSLREAIRDGDAGTVENLLASPELGELGVDEALLREGEEALEAAEAARRRRVRLWAGAMTLLMVAAMAGTAYVYNAKQFAKRLEAARVALQTASTGARPWVVLDKQLKNLEQNDPKVYASDDVQQFKGVLKKIQDGRAERRAEANRLLNALAELDAGNWSAAAEGETDELFAKARAPMDEDMAEEAERAAALELRWGKEKEARRQALLEEGRAALPDLTAKKDALAELLGKNYLTDELEASAAGWFGAAREWRKRYGALAIAEDAEVERLSRELEEARKASDDAKNALARLLSATGAVETVEARDVLRRHYRGYPGVEEMGDLPVTAEQVAAALAGTLPEQANVRRLRQAMSSELEWTQFLPMQMWIVEEIKELTQLYGIDRGDQFEAVSVGRAHLSTLTGSSIGAKGELFWFVSGEMEREVNFSPRVWKQNYQILLPPCEELLDVVNESRAPKMTPGRLASVLYNRIAEHVKASHGEAVPPFGDYNYHDVETGRGGMQALKAERYPAYKRVQMMALYFDWLEKLGALPMAGDPKSRVVDECRRLAEPIVLSKNVNPALSWTHLQNSRVTQRNKECADFLTGIPENFTQACQTSLSERAKLQQISAWKIEFAGKMGFKPESPGTAGWDLLPGIEVDHPLYVMRAEGAHVIFKPMVWNRKNGQWGLAGDGWLPGEPLYQFKIQGKYGYAEEQLKYILLDVSPEARRYFVNCNYVVEANK